jgi:hypothetical protein
LRIAVHYPLVTIHHLLFAAAQLLLAIAASCTYSLPSCTFPHFSTLTHLLSAACCLLHHADEAHGGCINLEGLFLGSVTIVDFSL